ncbi:MAG: hypothetical protein IBJ03_02030 [Gemmatimonadaceae bacterium]|nr:hypothetical protein [Gemmatimonadaceae bacterium]
MKFVCFCYYDPKVANALGSSDAEALSAACVPHYDAWQKTGSLIAMGGLSDPQLWKTIRPTDTAEHIHSEPVVANGPYQSTAHRVGAFFLVEAKDIEEAVAIASKHPSAHTGRFLGGGIEVSVCEGFEMQLP